MITLEQIKLRGSDKMTEAKRREILKMFDNLGADQETDMLNDFAVYGAFITVALNPNATDPLAICKPSALIAFKGFLNLEMEFSTEDATRTLRSVCNLFSAWGMLTSDEVTCVLDEPQPNCDNQYLLCNPSAHEICIFSSLFRCGEPDKAVLVNLREVNSLMNTADTPHFKALLANYLNDKNHSQGEIEATVICDFMTGLLSERPGVRLRDLHLNAKETREFVLSAKCASIDNLLRAGYALETAWQYWDPAEDIIYAFFEPHGFIALH
ncbi:hypothetical protein [Pseudomonas sp. DG56-2]|uniref:hypothetical protein n=1 Tax=Pseudomonas sp. DG56-2 TaxID=2320270 RepID=UPI000FB7B0C1|nr:hypothetical protein [Pseudomonas sp. DG56-2]